MCGGQGNGGGGGRGRVCWAVRSGEGGVDATVGKMGERKEERGNAGGKEARVEERRDGWMRQGVGSGEAGGMAEHGWVEEEKDARKGDSTVGQGAREGG